MRPIKQIAVTPTPKSETVFALCEDGTLWALEDYLMNPKTKWRRLPAIPETCINKTPRMGWSQSHVEALEVLER